MSPPRTFFTPPYSKTTPYLLLDLLLEALKRGVEFPVLEVLADVLEDFFLSGLGHYLNLIILT